MISKLKESLDIDIWYGNVTFALLFWTISSEMINLSIYISFPEEKQ